jgi:hypothetical protein
MPTSCSLSAPHASAVPQSSNGKYLSVDPSHLLAPRSELGGPDSFLELHRVSVSPSRYAVRTAFGRFLNVDDNIELALKDKASKDVGLRADRLGDTLTERERMFEVVEVPGGVAIKVPGPEDFFLAVDAGETKVKLARNATYAPPAAAAAATEATSPTNATAAVAPASPTSASAPSASTATSAPAAASPFASFIPSPAEVFVPTWLDDRSPLTLAGRHIIRTVHGLLWCVEPDGTLVANRYAPSLWEPVVLLSASLTHVAFRSVHGGLLSFDPTGRKLADFTSQSLGPEQRFEVVEIDKRAGTYAFKAANGLYLCAQGTHTITASSKHCGPWETFQLTPWTHEI